MVCHIPLLSWGPSPRACKGTVPLGNKTFETVHLGTKSRKAPFSESEIHRAGVALLSAGHPVPSGEVPQQNWPLSTLLLDFKAESFLYLCIRGEKLVDSSSLPRILLCRPQKAWSTPQHLSAPSLIPDITRRSWPSGTSRIRTTRVALDVGFPRTRASRTRRTRASAGLQPNRTGAVLKLKVLSCGASERSCSVCTVTSCQRNRRSAKIFALMRRRWCGCPRGDSEFPRSGNVRLIVD